MGGIVLGLPALGNLSNDNNDELDRCFQLATSPKPEK
jgi:hypothetical protein